MYQTTASVLVAGRPTLFRYGLLSLLHERWPRLLLTLTAALTQATELVVRQPFNLLVLDESLAEAALPKLLGRLHLARPGQRALLLLNAASARQLGHQLRPWPRPWLVLPARVAPAALAETLAQWLDSPLVAALLPVGRPATLLTEQAGFSARELEVLHLVVGDCCNREIANRLCLSVRTVESHRRALLHKAGTHSLVGLAVLAVREGWIS